ncbi:ORF33 [Agrotis segetum granulovirus]|uniref:ORF33 n=1 Tax=Agrotis segetum granulosis virus TaxID=10464 RepID=Q6QXF2_GVAS|nr:odv-e66 [Agrotis segetum granulovirus]AAS82705.1 ORF33 [Agrotis segetum granulovirus]AHN92076.1 odv-e66 [Agrotis segetum granulovirus]AKN63311.1 odv-e66 [Agrotis segetum granulovirus]
MVIILIIIIGVLIVACLIYYYLSQINWLYLFPDTFSQGRHVKIFNDYFINTLNENLNKRSYKVTKPNRAWDPDQIFDDAYPWKSTIRFKYVCYTLIGYCARFVNYDDELYQSPDLAYNLITSQQTIATHLGTTASVKPPWGVATDWYVFRVILLEAFMTITAVLSNTVFYLESARITSFYVELYLPSLEVGFVRNITDVMRMGVPYMYNKLLHNDLISSLEIDDLSVKKLMQTVSSPVVVHGTGLHKDYIPVERMFARSYNTIVKAYYTLDYYGVLFQKDVTDMELINKALRKASCPEGFIHPALLPPLFKSFNCSNVGKLTDYPLGIRSADYSKVLSNLTKDYFGSTVGATPRLAYYESTPLHDKFGPAFAMAKKIWNRNYPDSHIISHYQSGVLYQAHNGYDKIHCTNRDFQLFTPSIGETTVCTSHTCGAMLSHAKFNELNDLEFKSCTIYYEEGMFQLYYGMGVKKGALIDGDGRLVVMCRAQEPYKKLDQYSFKAQAIFNDGAVEGCHWNGISCYSVPIEGDVEIPPLTVRDNLLHELVEQVLTAENLYAYKGIASYKLNVEGLTDKLKCKILSGGNKFLVTMEENKKVLFAFPWLLIKERKLITIGGVNEVTEIPVNTVKRLLQLAEIKRDPFPINCNLEENSFVLKDTSEYLQFKFEMVRDAANIYNLMRN